MEAGAQPAVYKCPSEVTNRPCPPQWKTVGWSVLFSLLAVFILLLLAALFVYNYASGLYEKYYEPLALALNLLSAAARFVRGLEGAASEIAANLAAALARFKPWLQQELASLTAWLREKLENLRSLSGEALEKANNLLNEKISALFGKESAGMKSFLAEADSYLQQVAAKGRDLVQESALAQKLSKWLRE